MERPPATYQVHGPAIREQRKNLGFTVQEAADAAGISRSYLQRLETGVRSQMGPPRFHRLRRALKATEKQLAPPHEPPEEGR